MAKKKAAKKKPVKKAAKKKLAKKAPGAKAKRPSAKLASSKGNAKVDPNQNQLAGFEDDRCKPVESVVKKIVDKKSQRTRLKEEIDELTEKLPPLFKKHKLHQYSCYGKTVVVEPGADVVKIKKATSN